jgi:hypothetical protein
VLWVLEDNPRARRFYERHGWTPTGIAADFDAYCDRRGAGGRVPQGSGVSVDVRVTGPDEYRAAADAFCIALMTAATERRAVGAIASELGRDAVDVGVGR